MKITAIRGKNIASLEGEFEVDFTREPLASAGLFAITGPTGAGKSTLLDVMCLALFNNTPRLKAAKENRVWIADVGENTLSQNDARNLLRRGSTEGYAEVEFVAVDGNTYCSRWSVQRAYNRRNGKIKDETISLYNRSDEREEQGTKTELLKRVTELLGLTFEQFTRAVVLAQGDFATFLKSQEKDKADLLEKITGTEIYSQISQSIYNKAQESKRVYDEIAAPIAFIGLMTQEESEAFTVEQQTLQKAVDERRNICAQLQKQIHWLSEYRRLTASVSEAQEALRLAQEARDNAATRYAFMEQYDLAQGIRDTYNEALQQRTYIERESKALVANNARLASLETLLREKNEMAGKAKDVVERLKNDWSGGETERNKARELDTSIATRKVEYTNHEQSHHNDKKALDDERNKRNICDKNINTCNQSVEELARWFAERAKYEPLSIRAEEILNNFSMLNIENSKLKNILQQQASKERQLQVAQKNMERLQAEAERLNKLEPTEIYQLRATLVEGEPCPVCGSRHHLYTAEAVESMQSQELNRQKEEVAANIETCKKSVEQYNADMIELATQVALGRANKEFNRKQLHAELADIIPDWEHTENLAERIKILVSDWNERKSRLEQLKNTLAAEETKRKECDERIVTLASAEERSRRQLTASADAFAVTRKERAQLLGGKSLQEVTAEYEKALKAAETSVDVATRSCVEAGNQREKLLGIIGQQQQAITEASQKVAVAEAAVTQWRSEHIGIDLAQLFSHAVEWVMAEKKALSGINEGLTKASTMLKERTEQLQRHLSEPYRPADEATPEALEVLHADYENQNRLDTERIAAIKTAFATDEKHRKEIVSIEKRLEELRPQKEAWARLNDLFGSADGAKFRRIAQGYTLDRLLTYANIHLQELSARYTLQRVPGLLALQVIDNNMLGEIRSVHTLSGGESFLLSLALALGLSSLSSSRMTIESLFIDEGFGALDAETLRTAMDALDHLQIQGRKIGVISHVAEMTERIPAQIQVSRVGNSHSRIDIVG